jgi:hypothetical protein
VKQAEMKSPVPLHPFQDEIDNSAQSSLPFKFTDYLDLVDRAGEHIRYLHKAGIDIALPSILPGLGIHAAAWSVTMTRSGKRFGRAIGTLRGLRKLAKALGQSWIGGLTLSKKVFSSG